MDIKQLIKECVREQLERRIVREIVAEQLHEMWESGELNESFFEASDDNNGGETDTMEKSRALSQLNNMLDKNPIIKKSKLAYALHPDVDKDSARHIFNDQLDGEDPIATKEVNQAIDMVHNAGIGG